MMTRSVGCSVNGLIAAPLESQNSGEFSMQIHLILHHHDEAFPASTIEVGVLVDERP